MNTLEAKDHIRDLVLRYCRAVDRKDFNALKQQYHQDSIDDHGGMFHDTGAEFIAWLPTALAAMKVTSHLVSNHLITIRGHEAEGEVSCVAYHLTHDDQEIVIGGRYLDKYIFDNDRWQFKHRKIVMDWNQIGPSSCDLQSPIVAGTPVGAAFDQDPAHKFFSFLET